jgi:hypothetical protein
MTRPFVPGWCPDFALQARARLETQGRPICQARTRDDRPLPPAWSLAKYRRWPFDQGQVGSCFSNASAQVAQIDMVFGDPSRAFPVSRRLVWFEGRKLDGLIGSGEDGGSVTNAVLGLSDRQEGTGAAHEDLWPYKDRQSWLEKKPPQEVLDDAAKDRFTQFGEVAFGDDWKRSIRSGRAIAIGIWWPSGWDEAVDETGRATGIGRGGFGHALAVIGWIDDWDGHPWWQIENSHGPIYRPVPAQIAGKIPGYMPAQQDKTFDFWVRDDWLGQVLAKGDSEAVAIAGPEGFVKRDPIDASVIMPIDGGP